MAPQDEPNPAMGWRAIRVGLDRPGVMKMQLQALLRATAGRELRVMFPFVAQYNEFRDAKALLDQVCAAEEKLGNTLPSDIQVGAMLETPSLGFAPDAFFEETSFISIGGNDLKQFFFAADRENERVRKRYDTLNVSFLNFMRQIVARCNAHNTSVSFCGEDAGRPLEAAAFAAMGLHTLSMRPTSIGPIKSMLRHIDLNEVSALIDAAAAEGKQSVRDDLVAYMTAQDALG